MSPRASSLASLLLCYSSALAAVVLPRDGTSSSTTSAPTVALVETTISGTPTTISVAVPTTPVNLASTPSTTSTTDTATESAAPSTTTSSTDAISTNLPLCQNPVAGPFCLPTNESTLYVGNTYWITWDADLFETNSTITIALNYGNDTTMTAWTSAVLPVQQSFVTLKMENEWLQSYKSYNLTFEAISYVSRSSSGAATPLIGPSIILTTYQLPAPAPTKLPSTESLVIALPIALGCCLIIVFGLFFGMRKHRKLAVGGIMGGHRKGYGERKSRRQRLGITKGAIRLEDREVVPPSEPVYRDADEITPAPRLGEQREPLPGSRRTANASVESLGSLVDEDEPNTFRRELKAQKTRW